MRCLSCHYDLRKLTSGRCPECGGEFDPNDPTTYLPRARRLSWRRVVIFTACTITAAGVSLVFFYLGRTDRLSSIMAGLFFWPVVLIAVFAIHKLSTAVSMAWRRSRSK